MSKLGRPRMVSKPIKSSPNLKAGRVERQSPGAARGRSARKRGRDLSDHETMELEKLARCLGCLTVEESSQLLRFFLDLSRCVAAIRGCR